MSLHTRDGLRLAAWYVPSRNGAAVAVATVAAAHATAPSGRSVLLIATGTGVEQTLNRAYHRAAPETELWELPQAGHTLGLRDAPEASERRVLGFFDGSLLHLGA